MRIYVASSWRNPHQPTVVAALVAAGHTVYDFRHPRSDLAPGDPENKGFAWSEIDPEWLAWDPRRFRAALFHPLAVEGLHRDMHALAHCDACVLVQPCGRSAHLELGYAAGAKKLTVVIQADGQEPELMLGMADHLCLDLAEAVKVLADFDVRRARPTSLQGQGMEVEVALEGFVAAATEAYKPQFWSACHQCGRHTDPLPTGRCPLCNGGWFTAVIPPE